MTSRRRKRRLEDEDEDDSGEEDEDEDDVIEVDGEEEEEDDDSDRQLLGGPGTSDEVCAVCGDAADGYHYGVRSCRGCNAFFRRAVTNGLRFTCRRGQNCPVDKNARCACRACRLRKCEAVGMDRRAVQLKSRPTGASPPDVVVLPSSTTAAVVIPPSATMTGGTHSRYRPDFTVPGARRLSLQHMPELRLPSVSSMSSTSSVTSPQQVDTNLLDRLARDYVEQRQRRHAMLCTSLDELIADEEQDVVHGCAKASDLTAIWRVQAVLMFEWVEKLAAFRAFTTAQDKTQLIRAFALRYYLLDNVFHTVEASLTDRLLLVNNTFVLPGLCAVEQDEKSLAALNKLAGIECAHLLNELVAPLGRLAADPQEFMALRLLTLWSPPAQDEPELGDDNMLVLRDAATETVQFLKDHYEKLGLERATIEKRLDEMLLLLPAVKRHAAFLRSAVHAIPEFGSMHEWNSFMRDLLKL